MNQKSKIEDSSHETSNEEIIETEIETKEHTVQRDSTTKSDKIFKAKISAVPLKNYVKIARLLTDTAKLSITPDGIEIKAIDKAMVSLVNIHLKKSAFDTYKATTFELGLDLDRIKKIADLAKPNEMVDLKFISKMNQLVVAMDELKIRMGIVDFRDIPTIKPTTMQKSGKAIFKLDKMKRGIIASNDITDSIFLGINRNKLELRAEKDVNAVQLRLKKSETCELDSEIYHENQYSCSYLNDIIHCLENESQIQLRFGEDTPLKIDYDFPDDSHMMYILCPRIEPR